MKSFWNVSQQAMKGSNIRKMLVIVGSLIIMKIIWQVSSKSDKNSFERMADSPDFGAKQVECANGENLMPSRGYIQSQSLQHNMCVPCAEGWYLQVTVRFPAHSCKYCHDRRFYFLSTALLLFLLRRMQTSGKLRCSVRV